VTPIRILLVDDHPMMIKGLLATIEPEVDMEVVGTAQTGSSALESFRKTRPDVTIMDLTLGPEMSGTEATFAIRREFPDARVIVLSAHKGSEDIYRAVLAGAITYLLKETLGDDLISIIREVYAGGGPIPAVVARKLADRLKEPSLTAREMEVLKLMAEGFRNKEIGGKLGITEQTTQGHVKNIFLKLGVNDRTGAVAVAVRKGILHF
jgi:DNA-binding NarL/FixJ family response regulator